MHKGKEQSGKELCKNFHNRNMYSEPNGISPQEVNTIGNKHIHNDLGKDKVYLL